MTNYNVELRLAGKRATHRYRNDDAFLTAPDSKRSIGRNFYFKFTGGSDLQGNPVDPPDGSGYVTGRRNVVQDIITIRFYSFSAPHWEFVGIEFTTIDGKPLDTTAHPITAVVTNNQITITDKDGHVGEQFRYTVCVKRTAASNRDLRCYCDPGIYNQP